MVGASNPTVAKVRAEPEATGDVEKVSTSIDTKGRQQPTHRTKAADATKSATDIEKGSTSVAKATARPSVPSRANLASQLNSLSWSDATPELRVKFIDNIGVRDLWHAMTFEQKGALINLINAETGCRNAARAVTAHAAPPS